MMTDNANMSSDDATQDSNTNHNTGYIIENDFLDNNYWKNSYSLTSIGFNESDLFAEIE
jgi:hypothetical protein